MTIHFAYPNVMPPKFIGCGRFAVFEQGKAPPPDYCKAVFNTPNKRIVNRAVSLLAPDAFRSDKVICEIKDEPEQNYRGDSMDLAYLLSFIHCSRKLRFENNTQATDLWCTGMIGMEGSIPISEGVDPQGFDLKLQDFLSENTEDKIFIFPVINFKELTEERYVQIRNQNIRILSLSEFKALSDQNIFETKTLLTILPHELSELTDVLFERTPIARESVIRKPYVFIAMLMLAIGGVWMFFNMSVPDASEIIGHFEHGNFFKARRILEKSNSKNEQIRKLKHSFDTPIKIGIYFQFQKPGQIPSEFFPVDGSEIKDMILTHKDNYRLNIVNTQPGINLFLYVFQKDTNDNIDRIFPNPVWNADNNPLGSDRFPLRIPPDKEEYLYLDEIGHAAEETIYVIASPWKAKDIEKIYGEIHQETDKGIRHQQIRQFLTMLELRKNVGLPSVFYKEFSFRHSGSEGKDK